MSADNSFKAGTNTKDPIATGYAGKNPPDVERSKQGDATVEAFPASTASRDPATGEVITHPITTDQRNVPTEDWVADKSEIDTITTSAEDTLGGATSQDVNRGLGAPAQGQTSAELHHNGHQHRTSQRQGKVQYGPQAGPLHLGQSSKRQENDPKLDEIIPQWWALYNVYFTWLAFLITSTEQRQKTSALF